MLVLSRHKDEDVMIGDIIVKVVDIRGDKVRMGIEAPKDVPVHRREVYEAIRLENAKSIASDITEVGEYGLRLADLKGGLAKEAQRFFKDNAEFATMMPTDKTKLITKMVDAAYSAMQKELSNELDG